MSREYEKEILKSKEHEFTHSETYIMQEFVTRIAFRSIISVLCKT